MHILYLSFFLSFLPFFAILFCSTLSHSSICLQTVSTIITWSLSNVSPTTSSSSISLQLNNKSLSQITITYRSASRNNH